MTKAKIAQFPKKMEFTAMDNSNTATVTMTDPRPNSWDVEEICTLADHKAIAQSVLHYAIRRCIPPSMVEISIKWPDDQGQALPDDLAFLKPQAD